MLDDDEISSGEKSADAKEIFHDGCSYCISPPPLMACCYQNIGEPMWVIVFGLTETMPLYPSSGFISTICTWRKI